MKRVLDVARLQTINWQLIVVIPIVVLTVVFLANLAIFGAAAAVSGSPADGFSRGANTGALIALYATAGSAHIATMTQVFPFALGLGVTRRAFYAGTALVVTVQSFVAGLLVTVLEMIERPTSGWGVGMVFFGPEYLRQDNPFLQWLAYTVPFLTLSAIGVVLGVVFTRWGQLGVYAALLGPALLLAVAAILVTWQRAWPTVGDFFTDTPRFALVAGYPFLIAIVLTAFGWFAIRRATP